jgi:hypothetical protein
VAQQVWGILVQAITMCIAILFAMNFLRGHPEPLKGIFKIGPFFPRVFLTQIVIMLAVLGVLVLCGLPAGIASLMRQDMTLLVILGVIGGLVFLPIAIYLFMRLFVAQFLIVDRRQGIFESLANSGVLMQGNKWAVFLAMFVVGVLGTLFTLVTCCIGTIFATPFFWLAAAVIYTSVTGQWREAYLPNDSAATT